MNIFGVKKVNGEIKPFTLTPILCPDYAAAQLRQYQRLTRQIKPDLEQYEKLKEQ